MEGSAGGGQSPDLGVSAVLTRFHLPPDTSGDLAARVEAFFELRRRWAKAHNLSGPRALDAPAETDLADAAALAELVDPALPLLDVGAGSGVPAVLLALLRPDVRVEALEPAAKRAAFLRHAAASLGLPGFVVDRGAWPRALREPTQVVSRAVFPVADWPRRAAEGGENAALVWRYLARERPPFDAPGYEPGPARDYVGAGGAARRLEAWRRTGG